MEVNSYSASIYCCSITFTAAQLHRQSGVTDVTARELVLEINNHLMFNVTEVQNLVSSSALATLVHFSATRFLLFGNVHARFLFISMHAVPVQLLIVVGGCWLACFELACLPFAVPLAKKRTQQTHSASVISQSDRREIYLSWLVCAFIALHSFN